MTTQVQLRAGEVEFTFESDTPIAVSDVKEMLAQVQELAQSITPAQAVGQPPEPSPSGAAAPLLLEDGVPKLHINSIADRLSGTTGPDVAVAAAAFLQIVQGKQSFTRKELLEAMKAATHVYNQNMSSNLSAIIKNLAGTKLNQLGNDTYALSSTFRISGGVAGKFDQAVKHGARWFSRVRVVSGHGESLVGP